MADSQLVKEFQHMSQVIQCGLPHKVAPDQPLHTFGAGLARGLQPLMNWYYQTHLAKARCQKNVKIKFQKSK
jgi:hypothetical protein